MISAGNLNHLVSIETFTDTPPVGDHSGEVFQVWAETDKTWASIDPLNGTENIEGAQITEKVTHKMQTRYLEGLTAKNRVVFETKIYEIRYVLNKDERNDEMNLLLEQKI